MTARLYYVTMTESVAVTPESVRRVRSVSVQFAAFQSLSRLERQLQHHGDHDFRAPEDPQIKIAIERYE